MLGLCMRCYVTAIFIMLFYVIVSMIHDVRTFMDLGFNILVGSVHELLCHCHLYHAVLRDCVYDS